MPAIIADADEIRTLATQLRLAANYAGEATAAVHSGLHLHDLVLAAALDPVGAAGFELAVGSVLAGPFGLTGILAELDRLGHRLLSTAEDYVAVERAAISANPLELLRSGATLVDDGLVLLPGDGHPRVTLVGWVGPPGGGTAPPRTVADLMTHLAELDDTRTPGQGQIDIQILTGTDAAGQPVRKVVVYLPGTNNLASLPGSDVNDLTTNVRAVNGSSTTYERGVLEAMRAAGVTPADDVTMVGHSQGGAVAVNAARDAYLSGQFTVTHVVTAGAPMAVAVRSLPSTIAVLALENSHDLVPALDGAANPQRPNITTVTFDGTNKSIGENHDLTKTYVPAAHAAEASTNSKVQAFLGGESGLFSLDQSSTVRYSIIRVP